MPMWILRTWILASGILLALATAGQADFTLVAEGQPQATITLGVAYTPTGLAAAQDLQNYLRQISGAEVLITVSEDPPAAPTLLVGRSPTVRALVGDRLNEATLGYDGFIMQTFPQKLVLVGNEGNGTRFAAFAFLELLGCRFFNPNPDGEYVPRRATVTVPELNVVSRPDFAHRAPWNNGNVSPTLTAATAQRWNEWFVKNRLGGVAIHHGHNYMGFCPPEKYFDEHPDYFPFLRDNAGNGRRVPDGQLCLSNPHVVELAVAGARAAFEASPDLRAYSLSPNDTGGWCECDACRALDDPDPAIGHATRVLRFNNQVAEEVAKTHPGRLFAYYAEYGNMPGPPVRKTGEAVLKAHPAVMPAMVNIYCLRHNINDPNCPQNVEYRWRLDAWDQVSEPLFMYEWYQYSDLPTPVTWTVGPRIRYYRDKGFLGYSGEILGRSPDNDLALYVAAKMLWDADQDPDALVDEFFRLSFQEAAEPMRAYYRRLNQVGAGPNDHGVRVLSGAWTPAALAELRQLLDKALQAAQQEMVKRRLERESLALLAHTKFMMAHWRYDEWARQPNEDRRATAQAAVQDISAFLDQIADQDLVAEQILRWGLERLTNKLSANQPVATNSARNQPGWSDEATFGDLWEKYRELGPVPPTWKFRLDPDNVGEEQQWFAPDLDEAGWADLAIAEFWEAQGYDYDGVAWYRVRLPIPAEADGKPLLLYFGAADESAWVWCNGQPAGEHDVGEVGWDKRFAIDLTATARPGAENVLAVKVLDRTAMGGLWKNVKLVTNKD